MIEKMEKLGEQIANYLFWPEKKYKKKKKTKKDIVKKEELNSVFYEIIPYHKNEFDNESFFKLLKNFSNFSERINFFILWNLSSIKLIVSFPDMMEQKFITRFYNYFPSSKIKKIDDIVNDDLSLNILKKETFDTYFCSEDNEKLQLKDDNFFKEQLFLFKDISDDEVSCIRYSLVLNWKKEKKKEHDEDIKTLSELLYDAFIVFIKFVFNFLIILFTWKKNKKQKEENKQEEKQIITTTWKALSIWVCGKNFSGLYYKLLKNSFKNDIVKKDGEYFSSITITQFSKLFHVPSKDEKIDSISYINYKRIAPPPNLPSENEDITVLWKADWADETQVIWLKQEDKARHVYIVGKTWVWKSTLLSNMVLSDLEKNRGLALIDPHGDLIETVLNIVPESRKNDIVLFDVSNTENPVWFNIFEKWENYNKDLAVSTVLSIFKKLYWHSWGPRLEYIFRNVLLALSDYENANFLHIMKMLNDKNFRKKVLISVKDPVIKDFWEKEFAKRSERFASEAISPIMNKVGQFVSSPIIRNIFWQTKSTINIADIMQNNKVLLVNLSKWLIWEDNSAMIGSFIVSSLQVETMKRANVSMEERKDFSLYIDEFQNFATESFATILSEARKYKLSLIVANQYISQIDESIQNAVFGNIWNVIVFNSSTQDAEILAKQFKNQVSVNDITSIPRFKAYTKIMIDGSSTDVFGLSTYPISKEKYQDKDFVEQVKNLSIQKYTKSKQEVEKQINENVGGWNNKQDIVENSDKQVKSKKWKVNNTDGIWWENDPKWLEPEPILKSWANPEINTQSWNPDVWDIFEWVVKLKFNYGLFVVAWWYEWLLHKKNINLPEGINWKDYYNIWDKVKVKLIEIKKVDNQEKAVWESI